MSATRIMLTSGEIALIDSSDEGLVSRYKWRKSNREVRATCNKRVVLHRLVMGAVDGESVDHINHDILDNRKANLRKCSHAENCRNQSIQKVVKHSRFKGVTLCKFSGRWKAQIKLNGKNYHLGRFATQEEAAKTYDRAARNMFGEFAFTNS